MMKLLAFLLFSSYYLVAQNTVVYKGFDFFKLTPTKKVLFNIKTKCSITKTDSSIAVVFSKKGCRDYTITIKKGAIPYSLNFDSDCCSGRRKISKRLYHNEKIIEYNYYSQHDLYKNFDSLNLHSIRIITKDSMIVNYYDTLFSANGNPKVTAMNLDSVVDFIKPLKTSHYKYLSGPFKIGVYNYDLYEPCIDSISNKIVNHKAQYIPSLFAYKWWDAEEMPCNNLQFRVRYSSREK